MNDLFKIPRPPTEHHIEAYKQLRLLSLRTNPEVFGSTYARELAFSNQQWRERLDAPDRKTLVIQINEEMPQNSSPWVATASVLYPEMLETAQFIPPGNLISEDIAIYALTGMWIHPDHRRKGLGRKLIEGAVEVVKEHGVEMKKKVVLLLEVHGDNVVGKAFYRSMGFMYQDGHEVEGHRWMIHYI